MKNVFSQFSFFIFISTLLSFSSISNPNYRVVSDDLYTSEFYICFNSPDNVSTNKELFWYKAGEIHSSFGNYDGHLLNGVFVKKYHTNQLAEKGEFDLGLKNNTWTSWFKNGIVQSKTEWKNGFKDGLYKLFDEKGKLQLSGKYKNDKKSGKWISFASKDTVIYSKGAIVLPKPDSDTISKFKVFTQKLFQKKDTLAPKKEKKTSQLKTFFSKLKNSDKSKDKVKKK